MSIFYIFPKKPRFIYSQRLFYLFSKFWGLKYRSCVKITNFEDMKISAVTLRSLKEMEYRFPSEIQEKVLPFALEGYDVIGQAKSGSGKTAAFGIAIIEKIDLSNHEIQALVLSPTRELAIQVTEELKRIGKYKGIKPITIYGGQSIGIQQKRLRSNPRVIVCTPGRLLDFMRRGEITLDNVNLVVIDEADKMLEAGFLEDVEYILRSIRNRKQIMLLSATMPIEVIQLSKKYMIDPKIIRISQDELSVDHIDQIAYKVSGQDKFRALLKILRKERGKKILIFTNTKAFGRRLADKLRQRRIRVSYMSGDLSQKRRETILSWFRSRGGKILVASDVAARGIDIADVNIVINYDFPRFDRLYVHRIGRTGRFGRAGLAISLITQGDMRFFNKIRAKNQNITIERIS